MSNAVACSLLDWDSAFFGVRIARLHQDTLTPDEMRTVDAWCSENNVDCLYFLARSDEPPVIRTAQAGGFDLVDVRITFSRKLSVPALVTCGSREAIVRPVRTTDVPALQRIARHSHTDTRFYADAHFPRYLCDALYETWIARSCTDYADSVFVAELESTPVGYLTCHLDLTYQAGNIGLVGVDKPAQGLGYGQALIGQALDWFAEHGVETVSVVTQGRNVPAQRLYQKNGFLTTSVQLWYHKWYTAQKGGTL